MLRVASLIVYTILLGTVFTYTPDELKKWKEYKSLYMKNVRLAPSVEDAKLAAYVNNMKLIAEHNYKFENGLTTFQTDLNDFTHMTFNEFSESRLSKIDLDFDQTYAQQQFLLNSGKKPHKPQSQTTPKNVNWVKSKMVAPIKDQGNCGCCWAFSAVQLLESAVAIKKFGKSNDIDDAQDFTRDDSSSAESGEENSRVKTFSEQQLLDCTTNLTSSNPFYNVYGGFGCLGGNSIRALYYAYYEGLRYSYKYPVPYSQAEGKCQKNGRFDVKPIDVSYQVFLSDEEIMQRVAKQPVGLFWQATWDFMTYKTGIYDSRQCDTTTACMSKINHAVNIVGYGTDENGIDYWLIRNSWGTRWGENGYARVRRGKNMCCTNLVIVYPTV